jgi:hypothetical protein
MTDQYITAPTLTSVVEADRDVCRAIALLSENLLTPAEFSAVTGIDVDRVPDYLASSSNLREVQRSAMQMRNAGALARLEAARHAREAVQIAAQIMHDSDAHVSNRLNAATFIAKVSGTERAAPADEPSERFTITIHLGDNPPVIIERRPPIDT